MMRLLPRFGRDQRGSPAVEFALIFPVVIILMLGLADLAFQGYVQSVLTGAVQKAGRDSTIQGNAALTDTIDQKVINAVKAVSPGATFTATRSNYDVYEAIGPEPFVETKAHLNGICDYGESYTDYNNNGNQDTNLGTTGGGGASDVTLYKMTANVPRLFPFAWLIGWGASKTLSASTILKNQPYATQSTTTPTKRNCP